MQACMHCTFLIPLQGRVQALQALSGTGALRVGAGFLSRYMKVGHSMS